MEYIIVFIIFSVSIASLMLLKKKEEKKEKDTDLEKIKFVDDLLNIKSFEEGYIVNKDEYKIHFLQVEGYNKNLLSEKENLNFLNLLSSQISTKAKHPFRFLSISRSVDVSEMIEFIETKRKNVTGKRRDFLLMELQYAQDIAMNNEHADRLFYFINWSTLEESEKDFKERCEIFKEGLEEAKLKPHTLTKVGIIRLFNMFSNPRYAKYEKEFEGDHFPVVKGLA